jgi:hypothetical protein
MQNENLLSPVENVDNQYFTDAMHAQMFLFQPSITGEHHSKSANMRLNKPNKSSYIRRESHKQQLGLS